MNTFFLGAFTSPNEGWIRAPYLNSTRKVHLFDSEFLLRQLRFLFFKAARFADAEDRIPNGDLCIPEVLAASSTGYDNVPR